MIRARQSGTHPQHFTTTTPTGLQRGPSQPRAAVSNRRATGAFLPLARAKLLPLWSLVFTLSKSSLIRPTHIHRIAPPNPVMGRAAGVELVHTRTVTNWRHSPIYSKQSRLLKHSHSCGCLTYHFGDGPLFTSPANQSHRLCSQPRTLLTTASVDSRLASSASATNSHRVPKHSGVVRHILFPCCGSAISLRTNPWTVRHVCPTRLLCLAPA